jgi:hypothetical protein
LEGLLILLTIYTKGYLCQPCFSTATFHDPVLLGLIGSLAALEIVCGRLAFDTHVLSVATCVSASWGSSVELDADLIGFVILLSYFLLILNFLILLLILDFPLIVTRDSGSDVFFPRKD